MCSRTKFSLSAISLKRIPHSLPSAPTASGWNWPVYIGVRNSSTTVAVVIAQRLIKFTEGYPVAVTSFIIIIFVIITVLAVQFIICIIVIQRTGNILCVWIFRKFSIGNIYYCSIFPLFGITRGIFWSPVAAALAIARWPLPYTASSFVSA